MRRGRRRRRGVGDGVRRACSPRAGTRSRSLPRPRAGARRSRRPAATRATCRTSTSSGVAATTVDDPPLAGADLHVVAVPSRAFAEVVRGAARRGAGAEPDQGPRPRERRPALRARRAPRGSRCSRARTWPRRSPTGLPAAAVIASDGREPRRGAAAGGQLDGLPRLRQRRPRRRRALRGGEERDRARGRRRRRPRPRRQREGGADHPRAWPRWRGWARRAAPAPRRSRASPGWAT